MEDRMLYVQDPDTFIPQEYNEYFILKLHKLAYYGEKEEFDEMIKVRTKKLMDDFLSTLYYCITQGCWRNLEFAKYCYENFKFIDQKYMVAITTTFLKNGVYKSDLNPKNFDYCHATNVAKKTLNDLVKYEELHDIIGYYATIYEDRELFMKLSINNRYRINILIDNFNFPNYFEDNEKKPPHRHLPFKLNSCGTRYSRYITDSRIFREKLNLDYLLSIYLDDKNRDWQICSNTYIDNIEGLIFELAIDYCDLSVNKDHELLKISNDYDYSYKSIMEDVRIALKAFGKEKFLNICLTKFTLVNPKLSLCYTEKYKPFLLLGNTPYNFEYFKPYTKIEPLYKYIFMYSEIVRGETSVQRMREYLDNDFIEYTLLEGAIESVNLVVYNYLMKQYQIHKTCHKILDLENEKFITDRMNIQLDEEELKKRMKYNNKKFNCYENYIR